MPMYVGHAPASLRTPATKAERNRSGRWRSIDSKRAAMIYHEDMLTWSKGTYPVSIIEGDGIGPEISQAVKDIFAAAKVCKPTSTWPVQDSVCSHGLQAPVSWEPVDVTPTLVDGKTVIPPESIESIKRNKVALKGPLAVCQQPRLRLWLEAAKPR